MLKNIDRCFHSISGGMGRPLPTAVGVKKLESLLFHYVSKYRQCVLWFCHKARVCRTDRQNYYSEDRTRKRHGGSDVFGQLVPDRNGSDDENAVTNRRTSGSRDD